MFLIRETSTCFESKSGIKSRCSASRAPSCCRLYLVSCPHLTGNYRNGKASPSASPPVPSGGGGRACGPALALCGDSSRAATSGQRRSRPRGPCRPGQPLPLVAASPCRAAHDVLCGALTAPARPPHLGKPEALMQLPAWSLLTVPASLLRAPCPSGVTLCGPL